MKDNCYFITKRYGNIYDINRIRKKDGNFNSKGWFMVYPITGTSKSIVEYHIDLNVYKLGTNRDIDIIRNIILSRNRDENINTLLK